MAEELVRDEFPLVELADAHPEAASVLVWISEHNAAMRENMLPTWEQLDRARTEAYDRGRSDGYEQAQAEIIGRILGHTDDWSRA